MNPNWLLIVSKNPMWSPAKVGMWDTVGWDIFLACLPRTQVQKLRSMGLRQRDVQDVLNEAWFFTPWLWPEILVGMRVKLLCVFLASNGHTPVEIASKPKVSHPFWSHQ